MSLLTDTIRRSEEEFANEFGVDIIGDNALEVKALRRHISSLLKALESEVEKDSEARTAKADSITEDTFDLGYDTKKQELLSLLRSTQEELTGKDLLGNSKEI
jgi:hypothetical protein